MVQLANPFSLLAEKHVSGGVGEEKAEEALLLAAEKKKEKDEKEKKHKKQRPRRRPVSSAAESKSTNGGQIQHKGTDSVSVSSSTTLNDVDQTQGSNTKEADPDAEGWQEVKYQTSKKSPRSVDGQTQKNQGAIGNNQKNQGVIVNNKVNVEEGIRQLQESVRSMNGSQGVKPRKPNVNGSARRRMQKNRAGAGQDQQIQANKETVAAFDVTETAPVEKKLPTYTLEEYEMMKKNGHGNKSEEQHHQPAEKDKRYKGPRKQQGGNRSNCDIEDVPQATVEKAVDTSFTMVPGEFPVLGKAF